MAASFPGARAGLARALLAKKRRLAGGDSPHNPTGGAGQAQAAGTQALTANLGRWRSLLTVSAGRGDVGTWGRGDFQSLPGAAQHQLLLGWKENQALQSTRGGAGALPCPAGTGTSQGNPKGPHLLCNSVSMALTQGTMPGTGYAAFLRPVTNHRNSSEPDPCPLCQLQLPPSSAPSSSRTINGSQLPGGKKKKQKTPISPFGIQVSYLSLCHLIPSLAPESHGLLLLLLLCTLRWSPPRNLARI